jgi:hypothetical protein
MAARSSSAAGVRLRLLERREAVEHVHILLVVRIDEHLGTEAAVLLADIRHRVGGGLGATMARAAQLVRSTLRYFVDTEHTDNGAQFELISIAVVCEDGREYYSAVEGYDTSAVTPWIAQNVVPKLPPPGDPRWRSRDRIRDELAAFVIGDDIEFWTMCAWVDWSIVVRLFGRFEDVPASWPMACWDLWQLEADLGLNSETRLPEPEGVHNALVDARYHARIYDSLRSLQRQRLASSPQVS